MADINEIFSAKAIADIERVNALLRESLILTAQYNKSVTDIGRSSDDAATKKKKLTDEEQRQAAAVKELDKQRQAAEKALQKQLAKELEYETAIKNEAKAIAELEKQNKALRAARDKVDTTTKDGIKKIEDLNRKINENTEKIRQNTDAATKQRMNIGNYPKVIANVKNAVSGLTTGMFPMLGAFTVFQSLLTGTERMGDGFERITSAMTNSLKFFSERLTTLNFSGLINGFRDAWREGVRYKQVLQDIEDAQVGLGLQEKSIQLQVAQLEYIAKSEKSSQEQKKAALEKIYELEAQLRNKRIQLSDRETQNELENTAKLIFGAEGATDLRRTLILGIVQDQSKFNEMITEGAELQDYLNGLIKVELDDRGRAHQDLTRYNAAVAALTDEQRIQLDVLRISQKLTDDQRKRVADAHGKSIDALKAEQDARNSLIRVENKQLRAEENLAEVAEKSAEAAAKEAREREKITRMQSLGTDLLTEKKLDAELILRESYDLTDLQRKENDVAEQESWNQKLKNAQAYANAIADIGNTVLMFRQEQINAEIIRMENAKAYELQLAGDNAARISAIQEKYAKKEADLKKKQAKQNKATAIFNAIIGTANAVINGLATVPFTPLGIIMGALAGALGAIQIGLIAAQPIPAYAKGTRSAKGGRAIVGEQGRELIYDPATGQAALTGDGAHMVDLGRGGQRIYTSRETDLIMRAARSQRDDSRIADRIEQSNMRVVKAIREKKELHIYGNGRRIVEREGTYWKEYMNKHIYNRN